MDKLVHSKNMNNVYKNKSHQFYIADAMDQHILSRIVEVHRPRVIIDLTNDDNYSESVNKKTNVAFNIINCCKQWDVNKYIYLGSVYCNAGENNLNITANALASKFVSGYDFGCVLRVPELYGPRQGASEILSYIKSALLENKIYLKSNAGNLVKNYLHVEDIIAVITQMIDNDKFGSYTISEEIDYSELEICGLIASHIGKECKFSFEKAIGWSLNDLPLEKKDKDFEWKPIRKFRDKLKSTVDWYKSNQWSLK